jgi:hypothetical protein
MKQVIDRLFTVGLRQIIAIFLAATAFLGIPAFSTNVSFQALAVTSEFQTKSSTPANPSAVSKETIQRIQDKAEDLGDSPENPIGDTGLGNLRELGENIRETFDLNVRQKGAIYDGDQPDSVEALDRAQRETERSAR